MKKEEIIRTFKIERLGGVITESPGCGIVTKKVMLALLEKSELKRPIMTKINGPEDILDKIREEIHFMNSSCGLVNLCRTTEVLDIPFSFQSSWRGSSCELFFIHEEDLINVWRECAEMVEIDIDLTETYGKEETPPTNGKGGGLSPAAKKICPGN